MKENKTKKKLLLKVCFCCIYCNECLFRNLKILIVNSKLILLQIIWDLQKIYIGNFVFSLLLSANLAVSNSNYCTESEKFQITLFIYSFILLAYLKNQNTSVNT